MPHIFATRHGAVPAKRDEFLRSQIKRVWPANVRGDRADKVWKQMSQEGVLIHWSIAWSNALNCAHRFVPMRSPACRRHYGV
jgi:hypothetical protein